MAVMRAMALYEFRSPAAVELQLDVSINLYKCVFINQITEVPNYII